MGSFRVLLAVSHCMWCSARNYDMFCSIVSWLELIVTSFYTCLIHDHLTHQASVMCFDNALLMLQATAFICRITTSTTTSLGTHSRLCESDTGVGENNIHLQGCNSTIPHHPRMSMLPSRADRGVRPCEPNAHLCSQSPDPALNIELPGRWGQLPTHAVADWRLLFHRCRYR